MEQRHCLYSLQSVLRLVSPHRLWMPAFIFFSFIFSASMLSGQSWLTHRYTEIEGLPRTTVYDICQDLSGRIWMAGRGGVSCYNGFSWTNFTTTEDFPYPYFVKIAVDKRNRIWAAAANRQENVTVLLYEHNKWRVIAELPQRINEHSVIPAFTLREKAGEHGDLDVVIGTYHNGLYIISGAGLSTFTTENGLPSNTISGTACVNQSLFVATEDGVVVIDEQNRIIRRLGTTQDGFPASGVKGIAVERGDKFSDDQVPQNQNCLWLLSRDGLCMVNGDLGKRTYYPFKLPKVFDSHFNVNLQPDYRGGFYLGNRSRVYYYDTLSGKLTALSVSNGLIGDDALSIFLDFERNVWISGYRGVSKIAGRRFDNYRMLQGLLEDEVTSLLEYQPGKFIIGHPNGVTFRDGDQFTHMPLSEERGGNFSISRVLEIQKDSRNYIWAACASIGVVRLDERKRLKWYLRADEFKQRLSALLVDRDDNVYVGSYSGLYIKRKDEERFHLFPVAGHTELKIRRVYQGRDGKLYVACRREGLFVYDPAKNIWQNHKVADKVIANNIPCVTQDSRDRIWVGTLNGLYILEDGILKKSPPELWAVDTAVYLVLEAPNNDLWVGTDNGLIRWDGKRTYHYSTPHGLAGLEINRAAGIIASDGRLWFGTNRGLSIYNQRYDDYTYHIPKPKLRILSMKSDNRPLPLSGKAQMSYKNQALVIHFEGISFLDERKLRVAYKLEGADQYWGFPHVDQDQVVRYNSLGSGFYRFHIKVENALGVWSDVVVSEKIEVLGPFYTKWWFVVICIFPVLFLFHSIYRYIVTRKNAKLLEKLVEERTDQLLASEKQYRSLFEESRDVVFSISRKGKILDINPAGLLLFGYQSKEELWAHGAQRSIYYRKRDRDLLLREFLSAGYVEDYELDLRNKSGDRITALLTATAVLDQNGKLSAIRGILRDITDKKRLEQQLIQSQKMEAIGTLAGGIAHDFNNILAVIVGYTDMILDTMDPNDESYDNITRIQTASRRAGDLVAQILTFSRQSSSREKKPINFNIVVKEALKLLRATIPATVEIRRQMTEETGIVVADVIQVHQVIMNLCTNALHAMRESGGILTVGLQHMELDEVTAAAYPDTKPGHYLNLSITDTGSGIEPTVLKRIFDPFFTTKKPGEGTGLGLSVIHGIVKNHGGGIHVYSELGVGTTFNVLFPCTDLPEESLKEDHSEIPTGSGVEILFVDDEAPLLEMAVQLLTSLGYKVTARASGMDALGVFKANPKRFEIVITDLTMPNMTGTQLAEHIKRIRPELPIILCTGFSDSMSPEQLRAYGIDRLLLKPINKRDLVTNIEDLMAGN